MLSFFQVAAFLCNEVCTVPQSCQAFLANLISFTRFFKEPLFKELTSERLKKSKELLLQDISAPGYRCPLHLHRTGYVMTFHDIIMKM